MLLNAIYLAFTTHFCFLLSGIYYLLILAWKLHICVLLVTTFKCWHAYLVYYALTLYVLLLSTVLVPFFYTIKSSWRSLSPSLLILYVHYYNSLALCTCLTIYLITNCFLIFILFMDSVFLSEVLNLVMISLNLKMSLTSLLGNSLTGYKTLRCFCYFISALGKYHRLDCTPVFKVANSVISFLYRLYLSFLGALEFFCLSLVF